jgi:ribosomal protein S18 acetylase RimI-like enzyme
VATPHPLDNPVWAALTGPHAEFAQVKGNAARYLADVSPFCGLADGADESVWEDLLTIGGPGATVGLMESPLPLPAGWEVVFEIPGVQLVGAELEAAPDPEAVVLGRADVPEMLDLVARTEPGPFLPHTVDLGGYLGIRVDGALVAMAGQRIRLPGWTEISAVCTDQAFRGQGLGTRLIRAVAAGIRARGETPFLHAAASNTSAIRLYLALGFTLRRDVMIQAVRLPDGPHPKR